MGIAVTPDSTSAYVTNFGDGTVSQYDINRMTGVLTAKAVATVAAGSKPIGIAVTPDGRSAYVVNDGDGTISQYDIDPLTGTLTPKIPATVNAGAGPTAVALTPDGKSAYVVNVSDATISQYSIDQATGALMPKTPATVSAGASPDWITVTPDGKSAYVTNSLNFGQTAGTVSLSDIASDGTLTAKSPATIDTGAEPSAIAVTPDGKSATRPISAMMTSRNSASTRRARCRTSSPRTSTRASLRRRSR
jgi:DNA-binding beta-propeller fold protein YncE